MDFSYWTIKTKDKMVLLPSFVRFVVVYVFLVLGKVYGGGVVGWRTFTPVHDVERKSMVPTV